MKHSDSFTAIASALAKAAAGFPAIKKNRTVQVSTRQGGSYSFTYATLDEIVNSVRPHLSANELVLVQSVITEEITSSSADGVSITREELLETRLIHSSGEWFANTTPVLVATGENTAQAYGSAITYARRYGITQLLCIVADEDDDGNAAGGNVARSVAAGSASKPAGRGGAPISAKQVGLIRVKLKEAGGNEAALVAHLGAESLEALPKGQMDAALQACADRIPEILQAAGGAATTGSTQSPEQRAARKKQHDEVAARHDESLVFMRYHLGDERGEQVDSMVTEFGDRDVSKATAEWRTFTAEEQQALWLAPAHGGWFTTAERDHLRAELATKPASTDNTTTQD